MHLPLETALSASFLPQQKRTGRSLITRHLRVVEDGEESPSKFIKNRLRDRIACSSDDVIVKSPNSFVLSKALFGIKSHE